MSLLALLEARRSAIDVVFTTTLQADTGFGIGADFTYVLQGALRGELGLLMNALMQQECSAAVAGIQPLLFGPHRHGASRAAMPGMVRSRF